MHQRAYGLSAQDTLWIFVMCLCTTVFSYMGYSALWEGFEGQFLASVMALGTLACLMLFNRFVIRALNGTAPLTNRLGILALSLVFMVLIFALSSSINTAAIAGKSAQMVYLKDVTTRMSDYKSSAYQHAMSARQFKGLFDQEANSWALAAESEMRSGAFTGTGGTGSVHTILTSYAGSFQSMSAQVDRFLGEIERLNTQADHVLLTMREVIESDLEPNERMKQVAAYADQLRALVIKMQGNDLIAGFEITVASMPSALKAITLSRNARVAQNQQQAIEKIKDRLTDSTALLDSALSDYQAVDLPNFPSFEPMSTLKAVFMYWDLYVQSWAAGIALDLLPLLLAVSRMIEHGGKKDRETENNRRMRMSVEEYMQAMAVRQQIANLHLDNDLLVDMNRAHLALEKTPKTEADSASDKPSDQGADNDIGKKIATHSTKGVNHD